MKHYRVTSPHLGLDHGTWVAEGPQHAIARCLSAQGWPANVNVLGGVVVEGAAEDAMRKLGLEVRRLRVVELEPLPGYMFE